MQLNFAFMVLAITATALASASESSTSDASDIKRIQRKFKLFDNADNIDQQSLSDRLRSRFMLKSDANIVFQEILGDKVSIDGQAISIADSNLDPLDIYTIDGDGDGVVDVFEVAGSGSHEGSEETILVSKPNGVLQKVVKMKANGETVEVLRVDGDTFASIKSTDVDDDQAPEQGVDVVEPPVGGYDDAHRALRGGDIVSSSSMASVMDALASTYNLPDSGALDNNERKLQSCPEYDTVRMAIRYDSGFCYQNGNSEQSAEAEMRLIIADVSKIYQRQGLCVKVEICSLKGFCNGKYGTDMYREKMFRDGQVCGTGQSLLEQFRRTEINDKWPAHLEGKCDALHLVYGDDSEGRNPISGTTIGCAYGGQSCNMWSTGVNKVGADMSNTRQAALIAHELGHNLSGEHRYYDGSRGGSVMRSTICSCETFSDTNRKRIKDFIEKKKSATCIGQTAQILPDPTKPPTPSPTPNPTPGPTLNPTPSPTKAPTPSPTKAPTPSSTKAPTPSPTEAPAPKACDEFKFRLSCINSGDGCSWEGGVCLKPTTPVSVCDKYRFPMGCDNFSNGACHWRQGSCYEQTCSAYKDSTQCESLGFECKWDRSTNTCGKGGSSKSPVIRKDMDNFNCSALKFRRLCNTAHDGLTCTFDSYNRICQTRSDLTCQAYGSRSRCIRHGNNCQWEFGSRTCTDLN